jgi:hypothetical protein
MPEIAYCYMDGEIHSATEPPDGYLFRPHVQRVPDDATKDQVFRFLRTFLVPCSA